MKLKNILERVDETAKSKGLSESEMLRRAGLSRDALRNWRRKISNGENPSANERTISAIAEALGVSPGWLTGYNGGFEEGNSPMTSRPKVDQIPPSQTMNVENSPGDQSGTIKLAIVENTVQVAATVNAGEELEKLIDRLNKIQDMLRE